MTILDEKMPARLERLPEIAYNLWWSWSPDARDLFKQLDLILWRRTNHNPVQMLLEIAPEKLDEAAKDPLLTHQYQKVLMLMDREINENHSWFAQTHPQHTGKTIAYFSAEFGLHNSLPIYSGGLGILSGDHAKEASDLGIPLIGVGFMYPQGYFRQRIPSHGWQEAIYEQIDLGQAPIRPVVIDGEPVKFHMTMGGTPVYARVWYVRVGRVCLYLMDTDVDENDPWNRELSARLYSGDNEMRIRQEIMLGIGGVRAIRRLGITPQVWHMNEGHSAFLVLETMREKIAEGMSPAEAIAAVRHQTLFTTHTPVPAGHDAFSFPLMEQYFSGYWDKLGLSREEFLELGRHQETWGTAFNMTVLALRMSGQVNGVSALHGAVSRQMWQSVWPDRAVEDVPIDHVTNGVHVPTWLPSETRDLFDIYLGPEWVSLQDDPRTWLHLDEIPDGQLWASHVSLKRKLMKFLRARVRNRWLEGSDDATQVLTSGTLLDSSVLTIGFARRFATYKRATLIFQDLERLQRIINDRYRPVQFIFAGKAHPADDPGKHLIQAIYNLAQHHELGGRIAFIEDYDMHMARYLVQGVDVWLNTPLRPREASGTSGMKAAINGIPNLSILDCWWAEGYNGANGWPIGGDEEFTSREEQDRADANAIYDLLENEIVPLYYRRDGDDVPRGWLKVMRESIRSCAHQYGMRRMLKEYTEKFYIPAMNGEVPDS
jgi:starch phosphorylase